MHGVGVVDVTVVDDVGGATNVVGIVGGVDVVCAIIVGVVGVT